MIHTLQHIAIAVVVLLALWKLASLRQMLLPANDDDILASVKGQTFRGLDPFISRGGYTEDQEFWKQSRGYSGSRDRFHNARCWVRLLQNQRRKGLVAGEDVRLMTSRANMIAFFTVLAPLEDVIRLGVREYPHVFVRVAANLYAEMEATMEVILGEKTDMLERFREVL